MCAVPNMAVFCSSLTSWFPGMLLTYFLNEFEISPSRPYYYWYHLCFYIIIIVIIKELSLHMGVINRKRKFRSPGNDEFIAQAA